MVKHAQKRANCFVDLPATCPCFCFLKKFLCTCVHDVRGKAVPFPEYFTMCLLIITPDNMDTVVWRAPSESNFGDCSLAFGESP